MFQSRYHSMKRKSSLVDPARFKEVMTSIEKGEEYIDCSSLRLDDERLNTLLATMMKHSKVIKSFNASSNKIGDEGARALISFLDSIPIQEIHLSENNISEAGATAFFEVFEKKNHPRALDIRGNPCPEHLITRVGFLAKCADFDDSLKMALRHKAAESVTLAGHKYMDLDVHLLRYILLEVEGLKSVDFTECAAGDSGAWAIGQVLKESKVETVIMRKCSISNAGVKNFIEAADLPHHMYIKNLDFSRNASITSEIVRELPKLLFDVNTTIIHFDLEDTCVTAESRLIVEEECLLNQRPRELKDAVVSIRSRNPECTDVDLQWVKDISDCTRFLWRPLRDSPILEKLNVSDSGLDDKAIELLNKALYSNRKLRVLGLANNKITEHGIESLCKILQKGVCAIEELNLANNDLGNDSATHIIATLRINPKIKILNVDCNTRMALEFVDEIGGLALINRAPAPVRGLLPSIESNASSVTEVDFSDVAVCYNDGCVRLLCEALAHNSVVKKLNLSNNIIGDTGCCYLADVLTGNDSIEEIILRHNSVGNRGALKLCDAFYINNTVKVIDFTNNMLGDEGVGPYPDMLKQNHSLREVHLGQTRVSEKLAQTITRAADFNREPAQLKDIVYRLRAGDTTITEVNFSEACCKAQLDDIGIATLCAEICGNRFVKVLNLQGNMITAEGCRHIAKVLSDEHCSITSLNLSKNPLDDLAIGEFVRCFPANKSMKELDLRETQVTRLSAEFAVPFMKKNDTILTIHLPEGVSGPAVEALERELLINTQPIALKRVLLQLEAQEPLESIDLHHQKDHEFGDTACRLLCELLTKNQTIRTLNLCKNKMTYLSVPYITEVMEQCPNLAFVDISRNKINDKGAEMIIQCIEIVPHLRTVKVRSNPISRNLQERIAQLLTMNLSSQKLKKVLLQHSRSEKLDGTLDFNGKTNNYRLNDEEVMLLAQALRDTTDVRALDLGNNDITDCGCMAIAEILRVNHSMEALYMDINHIGREGGEALFFALKINPQLHTLNLENTDIPKPILEDITSLLHVNQTPLKDRIDMRNMTVDELNDLLQFRSTDYYASQTENLEDEALERCKKAEQLLLE